MTTETSVRADVRAWLEANWKPEMSLREWRELLADSGLTLPVSAMTSPSDVPQQKPG